MAYPLKTGDEVAMKTGAEIVRGTITMEGSTLVVDSRRFQPNPYFKGLWSRADGQSAVLMEHHKRWR